MRDCKHNHRGDRNNASANLDQRRRYRTVLTVDKQMLESSHDAVARRRRHEFLQVLCPNEFRVLYEARAFVDVRPQRVVAQADVLQYRQIGVHCAIRLADPFSHEPWMVLQPRRDQIDCDFGIDQ